MRRVRSFLPRFLLFFQKERNNHGPPVIHEGSGDVVVVVDEERGRWAASEGGETRRDGRETISDESSYVDLDYDGNAFLLIHKFEIFLQV